MYQRWESLLFLHWRLPPARIQETIPRALTVDTFDGEAFVGVTPFLMRNVRPVGLPAVPWLSDFHELNVRTYVHDRHGVPGVWFYSLDCDQRLAVLAARVFTGLPYLNAAMSATKRDGWNEYTCRREGTDEVACYRYRGLGVAAAEAHPDSLEFFLLERYYLYAERAGALIRAQVSHEPYAFRPAEVAQSSALPARLDGLAELPDLPMHACFIDGIDVNVYATEMLA